MRIIDRHIAKSILITFAAAVLVFCFLYILIDTASNLNEIINRKVSLAILIQYYSSFLPIIIVQTSTIACLIAVLLTFGHLSHDNEIVALRTAGMNFWAVVRPALCLTLIISAFTFWVNERFVPQATMSSNEIRDQNIILETDTNRKQQEKIKNLTFYGLKNRLYFIDTFDPNNFTLEGATIISQDDQQNMKEKIVALKGKWTGIAWKLYHCQIITFNPSDMSRSEDIKYSEEKLMDIKETPQDFLRQRLDVSAMNIRQLYSYIKRFKRSGATKAINNLRVDLHQKIAFPFSNMAIVLVGLPIALSVGRRKGLTFTSLGIAIALGFFFYVINAVGLALGKGGLLPPIASAWIAPLIFFATAFSLIKSRF